MMAAVLALALARGPVTGLTGDWVLVTVNRVIAPDQTPGQCFIRARIDRVVHGLSFQSGQSIAISLACRQGGLTPTAVSIPEPPTIQTLRARKHALVHVDASGRVIDNGYYSFSSPEPSIPGAP